MTHEQTDNPWDRFVAGHAVGDLVRGQVTKVVPFGVFVRLGDDFESLLHQDELDVPLEVGAAVDVRIREIDTERHRVVLSAV